MPFIAYAGARPSAGLGQICSRLFNESFTKSPPYRVAMTMARLNLEFKIKEIIAGEQNKYMVPSEKSLVHPFQNPGGPLSVTE